MKKSEVTVGHIYRVRVSGQIVPVQLVRENAFKKGWTGLNLNTNREIHIKTAARLRSEVKP